MYLRLNKRSFPAAAQAFTLIELLVVTSILGVVIGTIGACMAAGIRVWDRAQSFDGFERDASIGLAIMEKDLRNMLPIYAIGFEGGEDSVRFPALRTAEEVRRVGSVEYVLDRRDRALVRRELSDTGMEVRKEKLVQNVTALSMTYHVLRPGQAMGAKPTWQEQEPPMTNFPGQVVVTLSLEDDERSITLTKPILLPVR